MTMNEEMHKKYTRLYDRINELTTLNANIAKLAFYVNENDIEDTDCRSNMTEQLDAMVAYRDVLQYRIEKGYY